MQALNMESDHIDTNSPPLFTSVFFCWQRYKSHCCIFFPWTRKSLILLAGQEMDGRWPLDIICIRTNPTVCLSSINLLLIVGDLCVFWLSRSVQLSPLWGGWTKDVIRSVMSGQSTLLVQPVVTSHPQSIQCHGLSSKEVSSGLRLWKTTQWPGPQCGN